MIFFLHEKILNNDFVIQIYLFLKNIFYKKFLSKNGEKQTYREITTISV